MKFTRGAKALSSARRNCDRGIPTFSNVDTPSTNEADLRFIGGLRVWRSKQQFLRRFVPGIAVANTISSPELLQRSTRALTPSAISRAEQKAEINQSLLDLLGIFDFPKVEQLRSANRIGRGYESSEG
jgi:hypothetical protein